MPFYTADNIAAAQKVYDQVMAHLRKQGGGSFADRRIHGEDAVCAYRGGNGFRCAIGIFIPDDKYDPSMENKGADHWSVFGALPHVVQLAGLEFLANVQANLHDNLGYDRYFPEDMREFAERLEFAAENFCSDWGLVYTPPSGQ